MLIIEVLEIHLWKSIFEVVFLDVFVVFGSTHFALSQYMFILELEARNLCPAGNTALNPIIPFNLLGT